MPILNHELYQYLSRKGIWTKKEGMKYGEFYYYGRMSTPNIPKNQGMARDALSS